VITDGLRNVCIGSNCDASASDATNQIVIGHDATGQADNSVTLGGAAVDAVYMASDSGATVHAANVISNSNYAVEGYSTGRNVLRSLMLRIENATTGGNYVKATVTGLFNAGNVAVEDDIYGDGTRYYYAEGGNQDIMIIKGAGLDGLCVGILSADIARNYSGTDLTIYTATPTTLGGNGSLFLRFANATSGALVDLDALVDTGLIDIRVTYLTSS